MKAPEMKLEGPSETAELDGYGDEQAEVAPGVAMDPATDDIGDWRPSLWDALVGYWGYTDPQRLLPAETQGPWLLDDEDFSSEHGYQAGFEGRSEFQYGEFERWI